MSCGGRFGSASVLSDTLITVLLVAAVLAGIAAASYMVFRSPAFWLDIAQELANRLMPEIIKYLSKPLSPEDQKKLDETRRRGWEWDHFRRKPRDK